MNRYSEVFALTCALFFVLIVYHIVTWRTIAGTIRFSLPDRLLGSDPVEPTTVLVPQSDFVPNSVDFELFLPLSPDVKGTMNEFENWFMRTLLFFWPLNQTNLLIVSNSEIPNKQVFQDNVTDVTKRLNRTRIEFSEPSLVYSTPEGNQHPPGWFRQMWIMFWADNFTDADFVGFIDTDVVFTTLPQAGDLFVGQKPVVYVRYYFKLETNRRFLIPWNDLTEWAIERPVMATCGTFPLTFKVDHIIAFREYVTRIHNCETFDEFYMMLNEEEFGHYIILCNYIWHFHRHDYYWNIQPVVVKDETWTTMDRADAAELLDINAEAFAPKVRVCQHYTDMLFKHDVADIMRLGYCYHVQGTQTSVACHKVKQRYGYLYLQLYSYEGFIWPWENDILFSYVKRKNEYKTSRYRHQWDTNELKLLGLAT